MFGARCSLAACRHAEGKGFFDATPKTVIAVCACRRRDAFFVQRLHVLGFVEVVEGGDVLVFTHTGLIRVFLPGGDDIPIGAERGAFGEHGHLVRADGGAPVTPVVVSMLAGQGQVAAGQVVVGGFCFQLAEGVVRGRVHLIRLLLPAA